MKALLLLVCSFVALGAAPVPPAIPFVATPLPLDAVRLTGGPLKRAQDLDRDYLLSLDPDRLLFYLRQRAGLPPKAAKGNGGWDGGEGKQITGHIAGHYLSAVSLMWAATGDPRFKERADYLVGELKEIQDKQGDGYIGAITDAKGVSGKELLAQVSRGEIRSSGFDLNGLWSPWYVEHKLFAGLRDAWRFTGNRTALEVEIRFAGWAEGIVSKLTDTQVQQMLNTEFGGMNEVAVDLYADTGDAHWLALADRFEHHAIVDPLARGEDILAGKHANTQVPKMLGSLARYVWTGRETDGRAAEFFWDEVALHHSFATGGHSRNEYFGAPGKLNAMIDGRTAETCNVYNMLKLTRTLFALRPDARYADFQERALFNHILGSIDPADGWTCYMVPVGRGVTREYETNMREGEFTCCVGTGMESHALHGAGLYYVSADRLWVNIYTPSTAEWRTAGVSLTMATDFPEGDSAALTLHVSAPKQFALALRRPTWAGEGFAVTVNGKAVKSPAIVDGYVELNQLWHDGDVVALNLPKRLRLEPLPDNPNRTAILWGPLVLAGDLGAAPPDAKPPEPAVSVFIAAGKPVTEWIKPVAGEPGNFRSDGVGRDGDVTLVPFYRLHRHAYAVYWDLFTPETWKQQQAAYTAAEQVRRQLENATVDFVQLGEMQPETDHHFQGEAPVVIQVEDRAARRGGKWFSVELRGDPAQVMKLLVTYTSGDRRPHALTLFVEGKQVGTYATERRSPEQETKFIDVEYAIPPESQRGQSKLTIHFEAASGDELPAILGVRLVRADAPR